MICYHLDIVGVVEKSLFDTQAKYENNFRGRSVWQYSDVLLVQCGCAFGVQLLLVLVTDLGLLNRITNLSGELFFPFL